MNRERWILCLCLYVYVIVSKNDPMPDTHLGEAGVLGAGVPQDPALEPFAVLDKIIIDIPPNKHLPNNQILLVDFSDE